MTNKDKSPLVFFWAAPFAAVLAIIGAVVISVAESATTQVPVLGQVPEFTYQDQLEQPFGLEQMKGKLNVVGFMFTRCRSVCPVMSGVIAELNDLYQHSDKVQFVSISVDPDYDSVNVRREYIDDHGVPQERWHYLRAPIDSVAQLMEQGFMLAAESLPGGHPSHFILVDREGQIRGYYSYDDERDINLLKQQIRILAREES
ncbi:MAG: SCO family protein [bacterium]